MHKLTKKHFFSTKRVNEHTQQHQRLKITTNEIFFFLYKNPESDMLLRILWVYIADHNFIKSTSIYFVIVLLLLLSFL